MWDFFLHSMPTDPVECCQLGSFKSCRGQRRRDKAAWTNAFARLLLALIEADEESPPHADATVTLNLSQVALACTLTGWSPRLCFYCDTSDSGAHLNPPKLSVCKDCDSLYVTIEPGMRTHTNTHDTGEGLL